MDGGKFLRRFERGREPHARLIHQKVMPEYEHLDVIWAMDAETQVFREVREVLWRTVPEGVRGRCRTPKGCEDVEVWTDDRAHGADQETLVGSIDGVGEGIESSSSEELSGSS